jgi:signal transduction histidine kinase
VVGPVYIQLAYSWVQPSPIIMVMKLDSIFGYYLNDDMDRKGKYLSVVYVVGSLVSTFYFLLYNLRYDLTKYNFSLIPLQFIVYLSPFISKKSKNIDVTAAILWIALSILTTIYIYAAGGLKAPGVFWLLAIPLTSSILFNRIGYYVSLIYVILLATLFYVLNQHNLVPMDLYSRLNLEDEKLLGMGTFLTYLGANIRYFVSLEERSRCKLQKNQEETETLLRILIHDVATPLSVIRAYIDRLKRQSSMSSDLGPMIEKLDRASNGANSILHKVREMRSIIDGKSKVLNLPVDLVKILENVIHINSEKAEAKEIKITFEASSSSIIVVGDEVILTMVVFGNLLSNAIKFTERHGKVRIEVRKNSQGFAEVLVQDNGIGMPAELANNLFNVKVSTTRKGTAGEAGTGYGMPLAKEYLTRMGGSIDVKSSELSLDNDNHGTSFQILLKTG